MTPMLTYMYAMPMCSHPPALSPKGKVAKDWILWLSIVNPKIILKMFWKKNKAANRQDIDRRYRANKSFAGLELCTLEFFYKWRHFCREILEISECTHIQTRQIFVYRHLGALWRFDFTFLQSIKTIRIHNFLARDTLFLK